ncbi:hypothetical protein SPHINGO391_220026 [Sphingomonas aurantiaca]|uniref:Uncharacterized protein n=1 Tax=Sphingomonas aurantiaca TaxID=185949 RepID=A0A5E7XUV7_9SPHN|nr:hypothetical protein SPHINGO391_220026 [Sphingomonas aurantiaca]
MNVKPANGHMAAWSLRLAYLWVRSMYSPPISPEQCFRPLMSCTDAAGTRPGWQAR